MPGTRPASKHKIPFPVEPFNGGEIYRNFPYVVWLNIFSTTSSISVSTERQPDAYHRAVSSF
ncbi:hypothetical protein FYK26_13805 [Escherichia albertii]|nr:hypothetical protein [Escherichia albertii]EEW0785779.1 hypothetical protein [Escherichia albertii]EFB5189491.1 hypothetical protein [Escherichia albertii]EFO0323728.1 hypothetical protein [Escherichia albertii]EGE0301679.1 hypothetical protein [Escherichia albertii]